MKWIVKDRWLSSQ